MKRTKILFRRDDENVEEECFQADETKHLHLAWAFVRFRLLEWTSPESDEKWRYPSKQLAKQPRLL